MKAIVLMSIGFSLGFIVLGILTDTPPDPYKYHTVYYTPKFRLPYVIDERIQEIQDIIQDGIDRQFEEFAECASPYLVFPETVQQYKIIVKPAPEDCDYRTSVCGNEFNESKKQMIINADFLVLSWFKQELTFAIGLSPGDLRKCL